MAELPTFISTAKAPTTTGVGSPIYVENIDPFGKSLQKVGEKGKSIASEMFKTEAIQAVNEAKLGATLKLNNLTTELAKMDPAEALAISETRIKEIYNKQTEGMSDVAREAFNETFTTLHGQAQANIQSQAVKNHNDQQQANLVVLLAGFKKTTDPIASPLSVGQNLRAGIDAINTAIAGRNITREEGAKMLIKFKEDMAEEGVQKWLNAQIGPKDLLSAYKQMDTNAFEGKSGKFVRTLWTGLSADKKRQLRSRAITEWSRLGSQIDKEEAREKEAKEQLAKNDIFIVYDTDSTEAERNSAIERLKKNNVGLTTSQYMELMSDVSGRTDVFNDNDVVNGIITRIIQRDSTLTEKEIITAENVTFKTKQTLIKQLRTAEDEEVQEAMAMIRAHYIFVPKDKTDALLNSNQMNAMQARVFTQVLSMKYQAEKAGENFDPISVTNKLIDQLLKGGSEQTITPERVDKARKFLDSFRITDQQSADNYIAVNRPSMAIQSKITESLQILMSVSQ